MRCKFLALTSTMSLLLFAATVVFWVRGYRWLDDWGVERVDTATGAGVRDGVVYVGAWGVGSTRGTIFLIGEGSRVVYSPADDIMLEKFKAREGIHLRHWSQPAVSLEKVFWSRYQRAGFLYFSYGDDPRRWPPAGACVRVIAAPAWAVAASLTVLPAGMLLGVLWRRRENDEGRCPTCSYDLTGNTSGICPECGSAIEPATSAPAKAGQAWVMRSGSAWSRPYSW
jgi:hypothetical protein